MIRNALALMGLLLLPYLAPRQETELDPRLQALKERISAALPTWVRDSDLAPASFAAWDLMLADGGLARCSLFKDAMGADPDAFIKGMQLAKPGAKLVGEPKTIRTPSAIEVQLTFEAPGEGYGFVWSQVIGLRGKTALSPALFSMNFSKNPNASLEDFVAEMKAKKALLEPAYAAHLRHAFGLRVSVKDDVATVVSGPSFPVPKGWKPATKPATAMDWTDGAEASLTLDVVSTLEHGADALILAATDKMSAVTPDPKDKHDVTFVDGKRLVRLKIIEQDGYLYLLEASAPVAGDKTKSAAFKAIIAPTFSPPVAAAPKPTTKKPEKGGQK
jgi:hypothetical protein